MAQTVAHVKIEEGQWILHDLFEHLQSTAKLAGEFAAQFGNRDWAELAGLLHDFGKYKADFQEYIRRVSGYERDQADDGGPGKVDHTAAGAILVMERLGELGRIIGYIIAGHHSGLPDWIKDEASGGSLQERVQRTEHLAQVIKGQPPETLLNVIAPTSIPCGQRIEYEFCHIWIRMLFSCLVDADFLDTEQFMDALRASKRGNAQSLQNLKNRFDSYMRGIQQNATKSEVNQTRNRILMDCREHANWAPGLFTLTVPTGGGKTLASMGFALDHAVLYKKKRIIVVIPYTSIIEQTSGVFRKVFGDNAVLEHHSNLDPERETQQSKLASENWDAPIVVTTNVQLFESLFAARTSSCRKLHNLTDSVIIFDEVQMLPCEYLKPIISSIKGLVQYFGVSAVLCTATQPVLVGRVGGEKTQNRESFEGFNEHQVREIMASPEDLAKSLSRVRVSLHSRGLEPCTWSEISEELTHYEQVLCIVSTRRECRELVELLPSETIHLSALMCGEHRSLVIEQIKSKLSTNAPIRVVSTQLVEAGVDLDFPVVYRALAGFDSIAQAAGRCNREGKLQGMGKVIVFNPPKPAPKGLLRKGEDTTKELLSIDDDIISSLSPDAFRKYFNLYFSKVNSFDGKGIQALLAGPDSQKFQFQFRTAAQRFQLIDDSAQRTIIVWYQGKRHDSQRLLEELARFGPNRDLMRSLQRFSVTIPEWAFKKLEKLRVIQELTDKQGKGLGIWGQCVTNLYNELFGLRLEGPEFQGDEFIC